MLDCLESYSLVTWTGDLENPQLSLTTTKQEAAAERLNGHSVLTIDQTQCRAFLCDTTGSNPVAAYRFDQGGWQLQRRFQVLLNLLALTDQTAPGKLGPDPDVGAEQERVLVLRHHPQRVQAVAHRQG